MRIALASLALLAAFAVPVAAHADTLDLFTFNNGQGQIITFTLPGTLTSPTYIGGANFGETVTYTGTSSGTDLFTFNSAGDLASNAFGYDASATGKPIYSGLPSDPTFLTGTYNFTGGQTLTITSTMVAATPEPSSFILLGTGALGVFGAARRKFRRA